MTTDTISVRLLLHVANTPLPHLQADTIIQQQLIVMSTSPDTHTLYLLHKG